MGGAMGRVGGGAGHADRSNARSGKHGERVEVGSAEGCQEHARTVEPWCKPLDETVQVAFRKRALARSAVQE